MKSKSYSTPTSKNKGAETSQAGNVAPCGHLCGHQPQRAVATIQDAGDANGHDQRLAQGSRASVCQRAVGSHSRPGYGPVISVNRPVRNAVLRSFSNSVLPSDETIIPRPRYCPVFVLSAFVSSLAEDSFPML